MNKSEWNYFVAWWNDEIVPLLGCSKIVYWTKVRQTHLEKRLKEHRDLLKQIKEEALAVSDWAKAQTFLDYDWLMLPSNLCKFLEGKYRNKRYAYRPRKPSEKKLEEEWQRTYEDWQRRSGSDNGQEAPATQTEFNLPIESTGRGEIPGSEREDMDDLEGLHRAEG